MFEKIMSIGIGIFLTAIVSLIITMSQIFDLSDVFWFLTLIAIFFMVLAVFVEMIKGD